MPNATNKPSITIYYFTGRQLGPISIPHSWCEECDLTRRLVDGTVKEMGIRDRVEVSAKPWLVHLIPSLFKGGWHPPVVMINGRIHSQGVVPSTDALREELTALLDEQNAAVAT